MLNHQPFAGGDPFSPLRHFVGKSGAPALLLTALSDIGRAGWHAQFFQIFENSLRGTFIHRLWYWLRRIHTTDEIQCFINDCWHRCVLILTT